MPDLPELAPTGSAKSSRKALPRLATGGARVGVTGVRRILDNAAHRAADELHMAERDPIHAAQWWATTALACVLLWIGQRLR